MRLGWTLVGFAVCGLAVMLSVTPWTLRGTVRRTELAVAMSRDLGLDVEAGGPVTIKLLPRPRVQFTDVAVRAVDGAFDLSAPGLSGELDILALLQGRWRLVSATLSNPTATVDIDKSSRAFTARNEDVAASPFRVAIRSGVFRLVSRRLGIDTIVTDLAVTTAKIGSRGSGLSATGSALWRDVPSHFTLQIGAPLGPFSDRRSSAYLQISSPAVSFSATGDISDGAQPQFTGRVAASSAEPGRLFAAFGLGPFSVNLRKVSLNGDAVARIGDISLSDAALRLNSTNFEGTFGYHADNGRGLIEGTLATGRFDIDGLVGRDLDRIAMAQIYRTRLAPHLNGPNLDLRISAGELSIGDTTVQDVALSLLCRDRRLEMTLDEALAFGGVMKAHLLGSLTRDDIEAHAELALSGVELGPLGVTLTGHERMTGTLTGKVAVDGRGQSLGDIIPTLAGNGQLAVQNGNFMGISVSQALKRFTRRLPFGADQPGQLTAFTAASSDIKINQGTVNFIDGKVTGPGLHMAFAGHGDLPRGKVEIVAVASPTDAAGAPIAGAPGLPIEMRGAWGEPLLLMEQDHHLPLPKLAIPEIDPEQLLP